MTGNEKMKRTYRFEFFESDGTATGTRTQDFESENDAIVQAQEWLSERPNDWSVEVTSGGQKIQGFRRNIP